MKWLLLLLLAACAASYIQGKDIGDARADLTQVHFLLWTRDNPSVEQELTINDAANLTNSRYDHGKPTKIWAHGWRMNGLDATAHRFRDELLRKEDCNFISVNWGPLANNIDYYISANNVAPVGEHVGKFVDFLVGQGSSLSRFHIIGFSLGAHVAGNAGAFHSGKIPRITGLDPAFPAFSIDDTKTRIDPSDGGFVDIVHTNSGTLLEFCLSFPYSIGHVDFWPNGGSAQPGCALPGPDIIDIASGCSHGRAHDYYLESINGIIGFISTNCASYENFVAGLCVSNAKAIMGYSVLNTAKGDYYLKTNNAPPYALG